MLLRTLATRAVYSFVIVFTSLVANANIFGDDRRVEVAPVPSVLQPIGQLRALPDDGLWGTAFLVGQCHIVTAFHVAFPGHKRRGFVPSSKFKSKFFVGRTGTLNTSHFGFAASATATPVKWGTFHTKTFSGLYGDWALLRLDDCLGRSFGVIDLNPQVRPSDVRNSQVHFAGFPQDRPTALGIVLERNCNIRDFGPGFLNGVDCAVSVGSSGGPVLEEIDGKLYAIGIAIREIRPVNGIIPQYHRDHRNIILLSEEFISQIQQYL